MRAPRRNVRFTNTSVLAACSMSPHAHKNVLCCLRTLPGGVESRVESFAVCWTAADLTEQRCEVILSIAIAGNCNDDAKLISQSEIIHSEWSDLAPAAHKSLVALMVCHCPSLSLAVIPSCLPSVKLRGAVRDTVH